MAKRSREMAWVEIRSERNGDKYVRGMHSGRDGRRILVPARKLSEEPSEREATLQAVCEAVNACRRLPTEVQTG